MYKFKALVLLVSLIWYTSFVQDFPIYVNSNVWKWSDASTRQNKCILWSNPSSRCYRFTSWITNMLSLVSLHFYFSSIPSSIYLKLHCYSATPILGLLHCLMSMLIYLLLYIQENLCNCWLCILRAKFQLLDLLSDALFIGTVNQSNKLRTGMSVGVGHMLDLR